MVRLVKGEQKRILTEGALPDYLEAYLSSKDTADDLGKRIADQKATMMALLEAEGAENERGHRSIQVEGVATITRERRVSETLNEEAAIRWLEKQGMRDKVVKQVTIEEFDYDAFMEVLFDKKAPQKLVDSMYDRNETFAFLCRRSK